MKKMYHHQLTAIGYGRSGGFAAERPIDVEGPMYEAQVTAYNLARDKDCYVEHRCYNEARRKWDYLATFHPDGTAIDWTGARLMFTNNPVRPWKGIR